MEIWMFAASRYLHASVVGQTVGCSSWSVRRFLSGQIVTISSSVFSCFVVSKGVYIFCYIPFPHQGRSLLDIPSHISSSARLRGVMGGIVTHVVASFCIFPVVLCAVFLLPAVAQSPWRDVLNPDMRNSTDHIVRSSRGKPRPPVRSQSVNLPTSPRRVSDRRRFGFTFVSCKDIEPEDPPPGKG